MAVTADETIAEALAVLREASSGGSDGVWLEDVVAGAGPAIRDWDVEACWRWAQWPERESEFPRTSRQDVGIDVVARRRSDGGFVAIQCKARKLNDAGVGADVSKREFDSFASASAAERWAERWLVTNGRVGLSPQAGATVSMHDKPVKFVNVAADLQAESDAREAARAAEDAACPHCDESLRGGGRRTLSCMQDEAVSVSVERLREHLGSGSGGLPKGQSRGRIILPCGTGKTRVSLRIVEALTPEGGVSVVLCPSIALVAQLRREYLRHTGRSLRSLSVCSAQSSSGCN